MWKPFENKGFPRVSNSALEMHVPPMEMGWNSVEMVGFNSVGITRIANTPPPPYTAGGQIWSEISDFI